MSLFKPYSRPYQQFMTAVHEGVHLTFYVCGDCGATVTESADDSVNGIRIHEDWHEREYEEYYRDR